MNAAQFDALLAAAESGIEYDGLVVRFDPDADRDNDPAVEGGGYTFEAPALRRTGLSETELERVASANADYVTNWAFFRDRPADRAAFLRWLERADDFGVRERYDALRADGGPEDGEGDEGDEWDEGEQAEGDEAQDEEGDELQDAEGDEAQAGVKPHSMTREWGQLRIAATLGDDGARRYELRHVDDADAGRSALQRFDDPLDARHIATYDDRGRYRPLKTAPTLQTDWVFPELDAGELLQAVDFFYPATVANWYREREGTLDVTHWRATAERQSGIYAIVDELADEQVEWIAESCCVDSQCLKRREWDEDGDSELDVPRGDGAFPCREPCSVVIAAARTWTKLEREAEQEYTLTLTPSEREQLEEIVGAVADDRVDEIREADVSDGANRYRARYLRAKRFDGDA